ncbi:MAG TPA: glycosyltransferase [Pyrinomonadaceae bacterium]|nr:glycosyltransferase [Pyrinomonadaceae bacterium]
MKNVLQFIGSFHTGGSERQAVQLVRLLKEAGKFNVFLATLNREGALLEEVVKLGFNQIPEFSLTSFYDLNFAWQIKNCVKFLRENKIEIVQTHDFYTNIFGITAAKLAGVNCKIASKRETGGMRSKVQKTIEKKIFGLANAVVVNSKAVEKYLIDEGISAEKIELIYNGLDLKRLQPKLTDRKEILEKLDLPTGENFKFITLVANLRHDVKNQPMFLRAAQKVLQKFPNAHFVLAGEGELREGLENLARELRIAENTHFIGRCEIVPELLSVSFAGALTSFYEGFSNSILEYMAAKLPVVATDVGGASEAIIENETGFLVKSDDEEALATYLIELLEDEGKARMFGTTARKIAEEKFSLSAQISNVLELYERKSRKLSTDEHR